MRSFQMLAVTSFCGILAMATMARAETKVEVKGVHLCCEACTEAVEESVKEIKGVTVKCDEKAGTVTLTAPDDKTAQKALDAIGAAGFYGDTGNKDLAIKDDSGATKGKVKSVTVTGLHNCCRACNEKIKEAIKKVDGVTGDTAAPKESTFEVTGNFDQAALVKALNAAGFHVKVKK